VWQATAPHDASELVRVTHTPISDEHSTPTTVLAALRLASRLHMYDAPLLEAAKAVCATTATDITADQQELREAAAAYVELTPSLLTPPPPPSPSPPSSSAPPPPVATTIAASPSGVVAAAAATEEGERGAHRSIHASPYAAAARGDGGDVAVAVDGGAADADGGDAGGGAAVGAEDGMHRAASMQALAAASEERADGAMVEAATGALTADAHALGLHWQVR
jgi:hypothetical protein